MGTIKKDLNESHLQEVVNEIVVAALRGTHVHLNLSQYSSCPRLWREHHNQTGYSSQGHYDSVVSLEINRHLTVNQLIFIDIISIIQFMLH